MARIRRHRRKVRQDADKDVKDRLIQTRVPSKLESALKEEAKKRRLTVSHLIRNMLEDTLDLVDTVVTGVDDIARSSAGLAEQVARDAGKIAAVARESLRRPEQESAASPVNPAETREVPGAAREPARAPGGGSNSAPNGDRKSHETPESTDNARLDAVLAWNQVVVNKPAGCVQCGRELPKGGTAFLGITADPTAPPTWLCATCTESMKVSVGL